MSYASNTSVPVDDSLRAIRRLVEEHDADGWMHLEQRGRHAIQFQINGRVIRFVLPELDPENPGLSISHTPTGKRRTAAEVQKRIGAERRRRARVLFLCVKAKFVSITDGVETFDEAFLPHIVTPSGQTLGEQMTPRIPAMVESGEAPGMPLLPGGER